MESTILPDTSDWLSAYASDKVKILPENFSPIKTKKNVHIIKANEKVPILIPKKQILIMLRIVAFLFADCK